MLGVQPKAKNINDKVHKGRDLRFRALISDQDWKKLPPAVQERFTARIEGGECKVFVGEIVKMKSGFIGKTLANLVRVIGAPLPLCAKVGTATTVSVTEDYVTGGQNWTRIYANHKGFPQVINSVKRFCGTAGLEEYIGFGINMILKVEADPEGLIFRGTRFELGVFGQRLRIPKFFLPLEVEVGHRHVDDTRFLFTLDVRNPLFGALIEQAGLYREEKA